jgi:hypothetical protein
MVRIMRNLLASCGVVVLGLAAFAAHAQDSAANNPPTGLVITVQTAASAVAGRNFSFPLAATGGAAPYTWRLVEGQLPPGLKLHTHTGVISGVPTAAGEYRFSIAVADSGAPPLQAQRVLTITVLAGMTLDWKQRPSVQGHTISGSVVVTNQTGQDLDLTVIVVAVNDIGRATTLGYQHFTLAADQTGPVIPFGSSPGLGTYVVHADAVAHNPTNGEYIYRARKQTSHALVIAQH